MATARLIPNLYYYQLNYLYKSFLPRILGKRRNSLLEIFHQSLHQTSNRDGNNTRAFGSIFRWNLKMASVLPLGANQIALRERQRF